MKYEEKQMNLTILFNRIIYLPKGKAGRTNPDSFLTYFNSV